MAHLDAPSMAACMAQDLQAVGSCAFKENLLAHACRCGGGHAARFVPTARYIAVAGKYAGTVRWGGALRPSGRPRGDRTSVVSGKSVVVSVDLGCRRRS